MEVMDFTKYFTDNDNKLNHCGTAKLETDRLILKKIDVSDAKQMYENFAGDDKVSRYMSWEFQKSDEVMSWLEDWKKEYEKNDTYYWGLYLKTTNELIGTIYLLTDDIAAKVGSISYCLGYNWWGNGYMAEALKTVISFAFEKVGYNKVEAFHAKSNTQSARVMQKAEMSLDGTLRQRCKTFNGYEDCVYYSILKNEYTKRN